MINGSGDACISRYSGGASTGGFAEIAYGMSKVDRIMLKFRPIAPKPTAAGSGSGSGSSSSTVDGGNRRRKRRYVRVNGNKKKKETDTKTVSKKRKVSENSGGGDAVVTLPLMPETPDRKENSPATSSPSENPDLVSYVRTVNRNKPSTILLSFNNQQTACDGHVTDAVMIPSPSPLPQLKKSIITSFVTMECVTETMVDNINGNGLGFTDLEMDTCPSFITDSRDTVVWTNKAYREMTGGGGGSEAVTVVVKKFNRVTMPVSMAAFTCRVKVTWGTPVTITAPCDVWLLRCGGYAWRLDVKAALSLGRYS